MKNNIELGKYNHKDYDENGMAYLMNRYEALSRYHGISPEKLEFVKGPTFIYNIDEDRVLEDYYQYYEITEIGFEKVLRIKPGNRMVCIRTYSELPYNIKESRKIFVYPHKTKHFRFITIEDVMEIEVRNEPYVNKIKELL